MGEQFNEGSNIFKKFVECCVKEDNSLLTAGDGLFTNGNLENTSVFLKTIKPLFDDNNEKARKSNKENRSNKQKVWGIGDIFDGNAFNKNIQYKDEDKDQIIKILLHCNWLMYLCSDRQHKQNTDPQHYKEEDIKDYFSIPPEWAIGPTFSGTSLDAMLFIVKLVKKVKEEKPNKEKFISKIEELCNDTEWKNSLTWNDGKNISCNAIVNILLFLCNPDYYLPIPAQNKKELIVKKLEGLIPNKDQENEQLKKQFIEISDIDKKLYKIRGQLRTIKIKDEEGKEKEKYPDLNPFWHHDIRPFWDESTPDLNSDNLSDETLIEYKKAMVLYGPPGTSKSYQARRIAENIIAKALKEKESNISKCINSLDEKLSSHIHILQMHPNYTYEDFIVGKSIEQGKVVVKPGKLLKIVADIDKDDKLPHFIILDEINRVDISRVFGELFTAMEPSYREKGVELSVDVSQIAEDDKEGFNIDKIDNKELSVDVSQIAEDDKEGLNIEKIDNKEKLLLKVPENMYFIGTMNMIDFSLEQVDFALRRRFLWRLSTYDEKRLSEIISEKVKKEEDKEKENKVKKAWNKLPDNYIYSCSNLNRQIEWEPSLGKDYVIGHAFFAEIVDIFGKVNDWEIARNILWQISILPTLEAYCGTMDSNVKDEFIKNCKESFSIKNK